MVPRCHGYWKEVNSVVSTEAVNVFGKLSRTVLHEKSEGFLEGHSLEPLSVKLAEPEAGVKS
jgi:hypothetical protein